MSEIKRRVPVAAAPVARPKARASAAPVSRVSSASKKNVTIARGAKPPKEKREPLKKRRKEQKKALIIFFSVLAVILVGIAFYVIWLPTLRISEVRAEGPHADEAKAIAQRTLYGTHLFMAPRNSIFLIPENDVRAAILDAFPDVEAISLSAEGLNSLSVSTLPRAEVFRWCGITPETADGTCYAANAEGLIFSIVPLEQQASTSTLKVYGPLDREPGESPIRARVAVAHRIPDVLRMIRAVESLGSNVVGLTVREDEADLYLASGTRVTYVLGREEQAAGLAASAFPQLSLNDGTLLYVDLRFDGKVYYRRTQAGPEAETDTAL